MKSPYAHADKQLVKLKQFISAEFHNQANVMNFDEVNVASAKELTKILFDRLRSRNRQVFRDVAKQAYHAALREVGNVGENKDIDVLVVAMLLTEYHPVTQYAYRTEARRKQDRLMEALLSAQDSESVRVAFERSARLWFDQSRQYVDFAVDEARRMAFEDAGVKMVRYKAEKDERTCTECREFDDQIYPMAEAPSLPRHRHCRCWLEPIQDN
ncbi:MAG: hypothetical protein Q4E18_02820 [Clostridia bacterium]|nr:hypothetical protein [Clostridia bacterium]